MDISRTEYMPHHITESDNCFERTSLKQNDEQKETPEKNTGFPDLAQNKGYESRMR